MSWRPIGQERGYRICRVHAGRQHDPQDTFDLFVVFGLSRDGPKQAETEGFQFKRFPDFGKELQRSFAVAEQCYDCAACYQGCQGYPASEGFGCDRLRPLPDVKKGDCGQEIPTVAVARPKVKARVRICAALRAFVKAECANQCQTCRVLIGQPCNYFERAVLGPPDYPYKTPGYDWQRLFDEYGQINPKLSGRGVVVRQCECGAILKPRERVCARCRKDRRRKTKREYQRVFRGRHNPCSTVNENRPQNIAV